MAPAGRWFDYCTLQALCTTLFTCAMVLMLKPIPGEEAVPFVNGDPPLLPASSNTPAGSVQRLEFDKFLNACPVLVDSLRHAQTEGTLPASASVIQQLLQNTQTPLTNAVEMGMSDILKWILEHGKNWQANDLSGAIRLACERFCTRPDGDAGSVWLQMAHELLDHGAPPNITTNRTGARIPFQKRDDKLFALLLEHGADPNAFNSQQAIYPVDWYWRNKPLLFLALNHGLNPNAIRNGYPIFYAYTYFHDIDVLQVMVDHGVDFNVPFEDQSVYGDIQGGTALHYLCYRGNVHDCSPNGINSFEFLLAHGADPNRTDNIGQTPLYCAIRRLNIDAARKLLAHGARINIRDRTGSPPIVYAPNAEIAQLLVTDTGFITVSDLQRAHELNHPFAVQAMYPYLTYGLTPIWFLAWVLLLSAVVLTIRRKLISSGKSKTLAIVQPGSLSMASHIVNALEVPSAKLLTAEWSNSTNSLASSKSRKEAKESRVRRDFERMLPYVTVPLTAWGLSWALFFVDPYLRALGFIPNLQTLGIGILLAACAIPLFVGSAHSRMYLSWPGLLITLCAMTWSMYWTSRFWHLGEFWMAILFVGNTVALGMLELIFWNSFNTSYILKKLQGRKKPVKWTSSDELDAPAGWDQAK